MKFSSAILIVLFALLNFSAGMHDYYVGITDIRYSDQNKSYQVTIKLFTDDLEDAVRNYSGYDLNLSNEDELPTSDSLIYTYLNQHFSLANSNGKELELTDVGRETELDVTWIYLETQNSPMLEKLKVKNSIFMEMHPEQTHVVNITQGGITKSTLLHSGKTEDILKL